METFVIKWDAKFETGIASIDEQHKQLFHLVVKLSNAYLLRSEKKVIANILFELEDYVIYHFKEEEELIITRQNPINEEHIDQHRQFEATIKQLKFDYVSDNKRISLELLEYLKEWLINHIIDVDLIDLDFLSVK